MMHDRQMIDIIKTYAAVGVKYNRKLIIDVKSAGRLIMNTMQI